MRTALVLAALLNCTAWATFSWPDIHKWPYPNNWSTHRPMQLMEDKPDTSTDQAFAFQWRKDHKIYPTPFRVLKGDKLK